MDVHSALKTSASYLEIDAANLRHNVGVFKELALEHGRRSGKTPLVGVVLKANAYGHGLLEVYGACRAHVDICFVILASDALKIRDFETRNGLAPRRIVVIGALTLDEVEELARRDVEVTLGDDSWKDFIETLRKRSLPSKVQVHIHIETGLSREGYLPTEMGSRLSFLKGALDVLEVKGAFSHFANTEDVTEQDYANHQLALFDEGLKVLQDEFQLSGLERHIAASAASLVLPGARFDVLRVGIALYGFWPSVETRLSAKIVLGKLPSLKPVLAWRCQSQIVKTLATGSYVGYGCTYRCPSETRIAVFPVGYFDGYARMLSSKSHVLINGIRCAVLGRVMMNHIVVDVTKATKDDSENVVATLLGQSGHESISAETLAGWAQTIHYEIVARLGAHLQRVVIES